MILALASCRAPCGLEIEPHPDVSPALVVSSDDPGGGILTWEAAGLMGVVGLPAGGTALLPAPANATIRLSFAGRTTCVVDATGGYEPAQMPDARLDVLEPGGAAAVPFWLLSVISPEPVVLLVDRTGAVWWSLSLEPGLEAVDPVSIGDAVRIDVRSDDLSATVSEIRTVAWDGSVRDVWATPAGHHGFLSLPGGRAAGLSLTIEDHHVAAEDGVVAVAGDTIERWGEGAVPVASTFDWWTVAPSSTWERPFYDEGFDWTHGSGLGPGPADGFVYTSVGLDAAIVLDDVGARVWSVGGPDGAASSLDHPHSGSWTADDTLLVFTYDALGGGHAVELARGPGDEPIEVWQHGRGLGRHTAALGQASRLAGGNTLVAWATDGSIREVTQEGGVVWDLSFEEVMLGHVSPVTVPPAQVW